MTKILETGTITIDDQIPEFTLGICSIMKDNDNK